MVKIFCSNINNIYWLNSLPTLINNDEIYIHYFNIQENISFLNSFFYLLNDDEKLQAHKYLHLNDANAYRLGRIVTKLLLATYNNCKPDEIEVVSAKNKKPVLNKMPGHVSFTNFNLSHSKNILLFAVSKSAIGIDAEEINDVLYDDVLQTSFAANEINFVKNSDNPTTAFYTIWTRKEALLKANGIGLIDKLAEIQVMEGMNTSALQVLENNNYSVLTFLINHIGIASVSYNSLDIKNIKFVKLNISQFI